MEWGTGGRGGHGSGRNVARGHNVAAFAVAMETEGCPWPRWDHLVDQTTIVDWVYYHGAFSIA